jgi:hypothetical protein
MAEKRVLESYLGMSSGWVLDLSDRTFGELVMESLGVDIHAQQFTRNGTSKANKLRTFWQIEADGRVARLLDGLISYQETVDREPSPEKSVIAGKCRAIADRLRARAPGLSPLKHHAEKLDAAYLSDQIKRMEAAVENDPRLAIGTAKELIETCCRTILLARGETPSDTADVQELTKATFKLLQLAPAEIPNEKKGAETIKRVLNNLAQVGVGLAELRNLYGTGHGRHASTGGLTPRHAKLAVGAAATLATFLFETHVQNAPVYAGENPSPSRDISAATAPTGGTTGRTTGV